MKLLKTNTRRWPTTDYRKEILDPKKSSYAAFKAYLDSRKLCQEARKMSDESAAIVRGHVTNWIEEAELFGDELPYGVYSKEVVSKNIGGLIDYLSSHHPDVTDIELETTRQFVDSSFAMFEDSKRDSIAEDADGSAAFIVHIRTSRVFPDYDSEIDPVIPALRYVPGELRASFMVGLPPFIIDQYKPTPDGKKANLICAPFFLDSMLEGITSSEDYSRRLEQAIGAVQDSVDFAHNRLGSSQIGFGAILPSITKYGQSVESGETSVTTGHGGTAVLIKESARQAVERGFVSEEALNSLGLLGLGSIGASVADIMLDDFRNTDFMLFDLASLKIERTLNNMKNKINESDDGTATVSPAGNVRELLEKSSIIVSAVTTPIDLYKEFDIDPNNPEKPQVLKGKFIIDDSQPASFTPEQVEALGGKVTWVVGRDTKNAIARDWYDYGTMSDERDLFGCEAEVNALALYSRELSGRGMPDKTTKSIIGKLAIRKAVTPQAARYISALFKKYGIEPSEFQAFGKLITK